MNTAVLPEVILIGGAVYVLETQAPPSGLPPAWLPDPSGLDRVAQFPQIYAGLDRNAPDGAAAKVDMLLVAAENKFQQMTDDEKIVAAQKLNQQLNLQPPLTGRETWQQVASVAGGAAASGLCSQIPGIGMVAGPLCAIAGSYVGASL
jgi:hypothetical protein